MLIGGAECLPTQPSSVQKAYFQVSECIKLKLIGGGTKSS